MIVHTFIAVFIHIIIFIAVFTHIIIFFAVFTHIIIFSFSLNKNEKDYVTIIGNYNFKKRVDHLFCLKDCICLAYI